MDNDEPEFILDENISYRIARGFSAFGENVDHINDLFPRGTNDVDWIREINGNWILITNDYNINKKPHEARALLEAGLSVFFIDLTIQPTFWEWLEFFVRNWQKWKRLAIDTPKPFAFRVTKRGSPKRI